MWPVLNQPPLVLDRIAAPHTRTNIAIGIQTHE